MFRVHCTHRQWVRKPDPAGFGRFTYTTKSKKDLDAFLLRCEHNGVRVDAVTEMEDDDYARRPY